MATTEPLAFQSPAPLPALAAEQAIASKYGLVSIPDTMPLPSRDDLRASFDKARQPLDDRHLHGWKEIIASDSHSKSEALDRYARLFLAQHCYSVLMSRHEASFRGKKGYLQDRIADLLGVDESTVRRQFDLISKDVGPLWWQRSF